VNANEKRGDDTTFCAEIDLIFVALASHLIAERENSAFQLSLGPFRSHG